MYLTTTRSLLFSHRRHFRILLGPSRKFSSNDIVPNTEQVSDDDYLKKDRRNILNFHELELPQRAKQKLVTARDAVELVRNGDTICVSGFVAQCSPELVLKALGERFENSEGGQPHSLTLIFGGGPGDFNDKGLNHLAKLKVMKRTGTDGEFERCMLNRSIGGHYGQVPCIAKLALENKIEAWTLPMGSISRMIRAQATHSPGHITTIGLGTYIDPDDKGGAANDKALKSPLHRDLVSKVDIMGHTNLMYKALPIDVAIIRGTTADTNGNITIEQESLRCDQKIIAAATKNSGGIVIAQVKRLAQAGSLTTKSIEIPAPFVDCVVVVDEDEHDEMHGMSYFTKYSPTFAGELKIPTGNLAVMPLDTRKMIARRAFFELQPNQVVNLGIGLPEGVASVASEEKMLDYITLSTEPGSFGGIPASGHDFGPSFNADSLLEMNQMFDFYDGAGLDVAFLGAAQVSRNGDVNVSRISSTNLTGPGGFVNISQPTRKVVFLTPLTTKGLKVSVVGGEMSEKRKIKIDQEGSVQKFVDKVFEKTFSGDEAIRRGQEVYYVTERAVFRRTVNHPTLELIEIAPGIDLQKEVLDQMEFEPVISDDLKIMDKRIYQEKEMGARKDLFGSLYDRCTYHSNEGGEHALYLDLFGVTLNNAEDLTWFFKGLRAILSPHVLKRGKLDMIINYDGFDLSQGLEDSYVKQVMGLEKDFYKSVKRYAGHAFKRALLKKEMKMQDWDVDELFDDFDKDNSGFLTRQQLRDGCFSRFHISLTPADLKMFANNRDEQDMKVDRISFEKGVDLVLKGRSSKK